MTAKTIHELSATSNQGQPVNLSEYKGKVVLIANTASKCGYTKQYDQLEALQKKYAGKSFVVLGFPSNDFGAQEPGSNEEIAKFCKLNYGVTFPLFDKQPVKGDAAQPVFQYLAANAPGDKGEVKWNFEKFLVDQNGKVVARFRSKVTPDSPEVVDKIEALLAKHWGDSRNRRNRLPAEIFRHPHETKGVFYLINVYSPFRAEV